MDLHDRYFVSGLVDVLVECVSLGSLASMNSTSPGTRFVRVRLGLA